MNSWLMLYQLFFLTLYRMVYDMASTGTPPPKDVSVYYDVGSQPAVPSQIQNEWAEKAMKRYAESQWKNWQRWNEAMFERSA